MNIEIQPINRLAAADFAGFAARSKLSRAGFSRSHAPPSDDFVSITQQSVTPTAAPVSMPTAEQMKQMRFSAMAQAVRKLIGGL